MLSLTKKTKLAIEAVLDIAYNARPNPVRSKEITKRQGVPQRYLEIVLQQLVHEGILKGVRGPRGGYRLAKERRKISIADIVSAVSKLEASEDAKFVGKSEIGKQVINPYWDEVQTHLLKLLEAKTIEDLYNITNDQKVDRAKATVDYTI